MKIRLFVHFDVKPEFVDQFIGLMQNAKTELIKVPGCEAVEVIQSLKNPNAITLSEIWQSKEIHDNHASKLENPLGGLMPMLSGEPEVAEHYLV